MTDTISLSLAGFRACYDDALFFLTEVEGLPETDPVVVGLRRHLEDQWRQMCAELLLDELCNGGGAAMRCKAIESVVDANNEMLVGDARALATDCGSRADAAAGGPMLSVPELMTSPDLLTVAAELLSSFGCDSEEPESDDSLSDGDWSIDGGGDDDVAAEP